MRSLNDYADDPSLYDYARAQVYRPTLLRFFGELRRKAHYLHALLMHASPSVAWIDRTACGFSLSGERYSVAEFCALPDGVCDFPEELCFWVAGYTFLCDRSDSWALRYDPFSGLRVRLFRKQASLSLENMSEAFPAMLALQCREALLAGRPILPSEETIDRYGFTSEDMDFLHDRLVCCNGRLAHELKEKYNVLHAIRRFLE